MPPRAVLTIGHFDGVHRGHRAILAQARAIADASHARLVAMAFDPHPATVLRPGAEPPRLMSLDQKLAALRDAGADGVVVLEPTREFLALSAEDFLQRLRTDYELIAIVEGPDFRFGRARQGDNAFLAGQGQRHGFRAIVVPRVEASLHDQLLVPVSSSVVRSLVGLGRVADAALCLTRHFALDAAVARGEQRGRTIGVPTVNLDAADLASRILPADGVYAGWCDLPDGTTLPAAISIGIKPTFGQRSRVVEAHLLDFSGDLYGRRVSLRFARWVRDQQQFPAVPLLIRQILRDVAQVRAWHERGLLDTLPVARRAS